MERYQNRGGNSGVVGYELGPDSITVQFRDNSRYLYDSVRPGVAHVQEMKNLAVSGQGLNSYINRIVKKNYRQKLA